MKKLISTLILISVSLFSLMAQNATRNTGDFAIDAGVGIGPTANGSTLALPPLKADAEYTVLTFGPGSLSVGAYFSLSSGRFTSDNLNYSAFLVGPMADVRCALGENFDVFGKLVVGYVGVSTSSPLVNQYIKGNSAGAAAYIGGTWYFSPKMGVGFEGGYGGPTTFGIHMTFKI